MADQLPGDMQLPCLVQRPSRQSECLKVVIPEIRVGGSGRSIEAWWSVKSASSFGMMSHGSEQEGDVGVKKGGSIEERR